MKTKSITYAMKRTTGQYENDTAEVTVELESGDTVQAAIAQAKAQCLRALRSDGSALQNVFYKTISTSMGREDVRDFFDGCYSRRYPKAF